jgi:hypothetical protein
LLNAEAPNTPQSFRELWMLDEDDLLLHCLHSKHLGSCFEGPADKATYEKVDVNMNEIGLMFGFKIRVHSRDNVGYRYRTGISLGILGYLRDV